MEGSGGMRKEAFDIPNIFESVYADVKNGGTWEQAAEELFKAGNIPYASASLAKMRVEKYLKMFHKPWYRVFDGGNARKTYLMFVNDKPMWTPTEEGAAYFETEKAAFHAIAEFGLRNGEVEKVA